MRVGSLVRVSAKSREAWGGVDRGVCELLECDLGTIVRDHSPKRKPEVRRVVDVLWSDGDITEEYTPDLEMVNESR